MKTFTKKQNEMLKAQAIEILKNLDEGQDVRDVMAQIYVDNLDDKTLQQGQLMADAILKNVKDFDADYRDAQQDIDRFIASFQSRMDEDKSCLERCDCWLKLSAAIAAAEEVLSGEGVDREAILKQLEGLAVSEAEATPAREKELREQARQALKNSSIMLSALTEQAQALQEMESAGETAEMLINLENREVEYRAVVSMLAYTGIMNGEIKGMPVDISAEQVTVLVCAGAEQARIMAAVGSGSMAVDVASMLLMILGTVVLVWMAALAGAAGVSIVSFLFGNILVIPASLMVFAGIFHLFNAALEVWMKDSRAIAQGVVVGIGWVVKGLKTVGSFVADKVIPGIVKIASGIWNSVKSFAARLTDETVKASVAR